MLATCATTTPNARQSSLRHVTDVVLVALLAVNAARIGAAAGAYGLPLLDYLIPHGPLELAGFALAGTPYLNARQGTPLSHRRLAHTTGIAAATLALAAVVEVRRGLT